MDPVNAMYGFHRICHKPFQGFMDLGIQNSLKKKLSSLPTMIAYEGRKERTNRLCVCMWEYGDRESNLGHANQYEMLSLKN